MTGGIVHPEIFSRRNAGKVNEFFNEMRLVEIIEVINDRGPIQPALRLLHGIDYPLKPVQALQVFG